METNMSRLFTDILRDIRKGTPVTEATAALAAVVRAVDETNKPGSVTITLTVKPSKDGSAEKSLIAAITSKMPHSDIQPAIFFSDEDGNLTRIDPRQEEMPLAIAGRETA
jgi:hypothetical protein